MTKTVTFSISKFAVVILMLLTTNLSVYGQKLLPQLSTPKPEILGSTGSSGKAMYQLPAALSYIGSLSIDDQAACNYLTRHKAINQGAYLLASSDKPVMYKDISQPEPQQRLWSVPGATAQSFTDEFLDAQYGKEGVYDMPTLTITTANGTQVYKAEQKIKVGGTSEITSIDMKEWGSTYLLGALQFEEGAEITGYIGGTNAKDIVGFGNLFMFGTDDAVMEGVNVYLHHKPLKYKEDAQIVLQVWYPINTADGNIKFRGIPVEAEIMKMADIKADGEDGAWALTSDGAVASFTFDSPLELAGKPLLFISVEGFSNDPATEDFVLQTDLIGKNLGEVDVYNRLAHNSFARLKSEDDYLRPINSFGGGTGSFAICPIINVSEKAGIQSVDAAGTELAAHFVGNTLEITTSAAGQITLFDSMGQTVGRGYADGGKCSMTFGGLRQGMYILRGPGNKSVKVIK
jgi:hypothetical protein